jgi:hypothetical protein
MAKDSKGAQVTEVFGAAASFAAVTPSDSTTYVGIRAIYVGGTAGTIVATNAAGSDVTFNVGSGATLLISPSKIKAASTATGIVALY